MWLVFEFQEYLVHQLILAKRCSGVGIYGQCWILLGAKIRRVSPLIWDLTPTDTESRYPTLLQQMVECFTLVTAKSSAHRKMLLI